MSVRVAVCLFVCFTLLLPVCQSARLLLMPFPYRSHVTEIASIGRGLLDNNHIVYMLLPESYPELRQVKVESGFKVIEYKVTERDFYSLDASDSEAFINTALNSDPVTEFRTNIEGFVQMCTNPLQDTTLPAKLHDLDLDLAVVDAFPNSRCYWILLHKLNIQYVSLTTQYEPWLWRVPALPSFVPFPFSAGGQLTERMTFMERVENLWSLVDWTVFPGVVYVDNSFVKRYLPTETYWSLGAKCLLWLIDTDVVLDYARPTMPNEVNVGGLSTSRSKPLTDRKLSQFVGTATSGLVLVTFGSVDFASEKFFDEFIEAFRQITELSFVWRFSGEIPAKHTANWPTNVYVDKWLPQNDLLGHNNTRLLITHCGANSQYESIYHAVPLICLPIWADQPYNSAKISYHGYGLNLGRMRDVTAARLVAGVRDVIANHSYADNVRAASDIFRSRDQTPRQRAVWWIEHVIQHGGQHLHSYGLDIDWWKYLMLDILAVCVLLPLVVLTSSVTACLCWCCLRQRRQQPHLKEN